MLHNEIFFDNKLLLNEEKKLENVPKKRLDSAIQNSIEKVDKVLKVLNIKPINLDSNLQLNAKKYLSKKLKGWGLFENRSPPKISLEKTKSMQIPIDNSQVLKIAYKKNGSLNNENFVKSYLNTSETAKVKETENTTFYQENCNNKTIAKEEVKYNKKGGASITLKHIGINFKDYEQFLNELETGDEGKNGNYNYQIPVKPEIPKNSINNKQLNTEPAYRIDKIFSAKNFLNSSDSILDEFVALKDLIKNNYTITNSNKNNSNSRDNFNLPEINSHKRVISIQNEYLPQVLKKCKDLTNGVRRGKNYVSIIKSSKRREDQPTMPSKLKVKSMNEQALKMLIRNNELSKVPIELEEYTDYTKKEEVKKAIKNEINTREQGVFIKNFFDDKKKFVSPSKNKIENNVYIQSNNYENVNSETVFKFKEAYSKRFDLDSNIPLIIPKKRVKVISYKDQYETKNDKKREFIENLAFNNRRKLDILLKKMN